MSTETEIESGLNVAAEIGAVVGGPVGAAVAAALPAAESAVNTVIAEAPHQTALTDVQNAIAAAAPVIAAAPLPAATAAQVTKGLGLMGELLSFFKGLL